MVVNDNSNVSSAVVVSVTVFDRGVPIGQVFIPVKKEMSDQYFQPPGYSSW